jgi:hypothetical protein
MMAVPRRLYRGTARYASASPVPLHQLFGWAGIRLGNHDLEHPFQVCLRRDRVGVADLSLRWDGRVFRVELQHADARVAGGYAFDDELTPIGCIASGVVTDYAGRPCAAHVHEATRWLLAITPLFTDARLEVQMPLTPHVG